jgi:hypothetical protein
VPLPTKLLLGLTLLISVPFAVAQNNLGELLDAGAKRISAEEFRQDVVQRDVAGLTQSGARMELIFASSGVIQGRGVLTQAGNTAGVTGSILQSIDGVWNIDDSGRTCMSMVIGRTFLPFSCQYWYKYKDDYFVADSDSDRRVRVLRRTVKQ